MKEAYCSYEISKLLKEKGFNESTLTFYIPFEDGEVKFNIGSDKIHYNTLNEYPWIIAAPTHQTACAWLREKGIYITIIYGDYPADKKVFWTPQIDSLEGFDLPDSFYQEYDLYEKAVEAALKYSLENLI